MKVRRLSVISLVRESRGSIVAAFALKRSFNGATVSHDEPAEIVRGSIGDDVLTEHRRRGASAYDPHPTVHDDTSLNRNVNDESRERTVVSGCGTAMAAVSHRSKQIGYAERS
jgi:hypothetical protein